MSKEEKTITSGDLTIGFANLGEGPQRITVYLPAGWPRTKPAAALYCLHGAGYDDTSLLGQPGLETSFKRKLDKAINNGKAPPTLIVCPHYSDATTVDDAMESVSHAADMLRRLVAYAEPTFLCRASRPLRAVAGFSMGGAMVWEAFVRAGDLFSVYAPVGSDCWSLEYEGGHHDPAGTAKLLAEVATQHNKGTVVRAWCGELDPSAPWMKEQIAEMHGLGFGQESVSLSTVKGVGHAARSVHPAILDCLKLLGSRSG